MNILVTGGAGFIGSHVADRLIADGHEVTIVDDLSTGSRRNLPLPAQFIEMDIRDPKIRQLWAEHRFEVMCHLAAQMDVRKSVEDPLFDADVNIRGTLNLLEAGRCFGLKKVIFASSGGAGYDDFVPFPTPETIPPRPVSPYGIAKITTELHLRFYRREYGIDYIALRLGNVYGPRQNPFGEAGVIAIFSNRMLKGEPATINGDGLQTRDYIYVSDVVNAFILALSGEQNEEFNIGTGKETNVVELFQMICGACGTNTDEIHGPAKPGEVHRSCLANDKAARRLNWIPTVKLDDGVRRTVEFFRQQDKA